MSAAAWSGRDASDRHRRRAIEQSARQPVTATLIGLPTSFPPSLASRSRPPDGRSRRSRSRCADAAIRTKTMTDLLLMMIVLGVLLLALVVDFGALIGWLRRRG